MKIISFNILSEQYIDKSSYVNEYKGIPPEYINRNYRIKQIIKVLKKYKADLMLLQEVDIDKKAKAIIILKKADFIEKVIKYKLNSRN